MIRTETIPARGHAEPHRSWKPGTYAERQRFFATWCYACRRLDRGGAGCGLRQRAMQTDPSSPEFPTEWTLRDGAGVCTTFEPKRSA